MPELLNNFFASGPFIPHGHCYLWQPGLVWLHLLSDALIALAYYSIPIALIYFVRKRQDLPFNGLIILFGAFIIACGTTHLMEIWTLWYPTYWVSGVLKAITAIVSLYTALELVSVLPQALAFPSLASTNKKLEDEIVERQQVVEQLHRSLKELSDIKFALDQSAIVVMTDQQGVIQYVNSKFCNISQYAQEELIGQNHRIVNSGYHPKEFFKALWDTISHGHVWHGEIRNKAKDGSYYWVDTTIVPFLNEQGKPFQYWAIRFDITERKLAEEAQQRYAQRVKGINTISRAVLAQQSSEETAQVALWHLRRLVPCQWAIVTLFDIEHNQAKVIAGDVDGHDVFPEGALLPPESFSLDLLHKGSVCVVEDIATLEHPSLIMERLLAAGIRCCMVVPLFIEGKLIGELKLADTRVAAFNPEAEEIASEVGAQLALAIQKARLLEQTQTDRERLQVLSTQLLEAQETERRHIARELHDEIGQALTAVKINLQAVQRSPDLSSSTVPVQDSVNIVEVALQQVRNLSLDLRPSLLDDLGLVAALRWYVDRYSQRTEVQAEFVNHSYHTPLPANIETACFRIVQEALTNVTRHAKAEQVTVELRQQDSALRLLICDNGVGFNVQAARERARLGGSLGLLGMEERALLMGGQLSVKSIPRYGTEIDVYFPIAADPAEQLDN